ncbi:MAG: enoyl-CoA hydratase-related protein, partial [archaeon]|nr:enoyl-CoA hydratase-related protein [archaeon]
MIATVHGKCIGAGVDLITACDIRYATASSVFSVKEVAVGLAADVGTLQRLPKVVGNHSLLRELVLTGRDFGAAEAQELGMVSRVFAT